MATFWLYIYVIFTPSMVLKGERGGNKIYMAMVYEKWYIGDGQDMGNNKIKHSNQSARPS